jgi:hypothetical protein
VLLASGGKTYVTVGSDHTDRKVETYGVTVSKQMCDKPIAAEVSTACCRLAISLRAGLVEARCPTAARCSAVLRSQGRHPPRQPFRF